MPHSPGLYPLSTFLLLTPSAFKPSGLLATPAGTLLRGLAHLSLHSALPLTSPASPFQPQVCKSDSVARSLLPGHPTDVISKPEGICFHKFCFSPYLSYDGWLSDSSWKPGSRLDPLLLLCSLTAGVYTAVCIFSVAQTHLPFSPWSPPFLFGLLIICHLKIKLRQLLNWSLLAARVSFPFNLKNRIMLGKFKSIFIKLKVLSHHTQTTPAAEFLLNMFIFMHINHI